VHSQRTRAPLAATSSILRRFVTRKSSRASVAPLLSSLIDRTRNKSDRGSILINIGLPRCSRTSASFIQNIEEKQNAIFPTRFHRITKRIEKKNREKRIIDAATVASESRAFPIQVRLSLSLSHAAGTRTARNPFTRTLNENDEARVRGAQRK